MKDRMDQMPSLSRKCYIRSSVTTSPRDGSTGAPPRVPERFFHLVTGNANPRRACIEIIWPAVLPSRCASCLAACNTSSSMSNVVLMYQRLLPLRIKVTSGCSPST
jgi:hypothetical protein